MAELCPGGREELLAAFNMVIHGAADIEQQQHLDRIAPFGLELEVEQTGIVGRRPDGAGHVQLLGPALPGETAQAPQSQLHAPGAELDLAVEIAELALVPDLDRAAVSRATLADPDALGVVAEGAGGRGAGRADPF